MKYRVWAIAVVLLFMGAPQLLYGQEEPPAVVTGTVLTPSGDPLPYVNVYIEGSTVGAASNEEGSFHFTTTQTGEQSIQATMVGYATAERTVSLSHGETTTIELVLHPNEVELAEAVVTGRSFTTGVAENATLQPLDIVTTPGAAADIFRAFQTLPGTARVDDGAGLFVRGGDVSETAVLLDRATVHHPYRFESPTGGAFGTIPPFLTEGTEFSTGGFSARYGNALSAVLAMETPSRPERHQQYVNLGLAAASLRLDVPLIDGTLGLRASGNRSFTGLLFRVNGHQDDFTTTPQGTDGNLSLIWDYSDAGQLKFFNHIDTHRLGVEVDEPSFTGTYRGRATTHFHNLQWTQVYDSGMVQTSFAVSRHSARRSLGSMDLRPTTQIAALRSDVEHDLSQNVRVLTGAIIERQSRGFEGTVPQHTPVLDPNADEQVIKDTEHTTRGGAYAELEVRPASDLTFTAGIRADAQSPTHQLVADPRLSLQYALTENTSARLAWGIYHQFPDPGVYDALPDALPDAPVQRAQQARHWIAGLHHERDLWQLRMEGYWKPYRSLTITDGERRYANNGTGYARGIDLFAKYGGFLETRFNGWLSYSLLESRRTQVRRKGTDVAFEEGPSPFDITHNLEVVGKVRLVDQLRAGVTWTLASGRPHTPVTNAVPQHDGAFYLPVEGPVGSEQLSPFHTLDLSVSYHWPFGDERNAVFYVSIDNALDRANVTGVEYNRDYSMRTERTTNFRRSIYVGVSFTL